MFARICDSQESEPLAQLQVCCMHRDLFDPKCFILGDEYAPAWKC